VASARDLFRAAGVSARLYRSFLEPVLLVTLFAPPEALSAAAALGALHYFALAHQDDWDVRWCRHVCVCGGEGVGRGGAAAQSRRGHTGGRLKAPRRPPRTPRRREPRGGSPCLPARTHAPGRGR
jgi:hypothetical protein